MAESNTSVSNPARGRGRGKSRGGLGKYLRARGRGGRGRPAEFNTRLVLEGERKSELTEEEEAELAREIRERYSKRRLGTNEDRYKEEELELDSEGEPIVEPEVDISNFLERQRLTDDTHLPPIPGASKDVKDDEDVDTTLAHISSFPPHINPHAASKKGKVEQIPWDEELDKMNREKMAAEATWDLKTRFRAKAEKIRASPATRVPGTSSRSRKREYQEAPALPLPDGVQPKGQMQEMEDFLDELLT